ncbi:MAG: xanthine dehydrogenase family protein subunit M [Pyrinomonadaceae bacterium]
MRSFSFKRAADPADAVKSLAADAKGKFIAGGTNLVDLMKEGIEQPASLVDISRLSLSVVRALPGGGVSIGALAKNADTANHPLIRKSYPLLTQAILAGASPQIRNMATNGGNLNQRTRCAYFYDLGTPCNKRQPGSGCPAKDGLSRHSAIFGWSDSCVAVHPSDMCVALAALDAVVKVRGVNGHERSIAFTDFHRLPEGTPEKDNTLAYGELITAIELPRSPFGQRSNYLKLRDRASYAFALVSVAAAMETGKNGEIVQARIALGGVAHKPWRAVDAEKFLVGKRPVEETFKQAADIALKDAKPLKENGFKVNMARRAIVRALNNSIKQGAATK